MKHHRNGLSVLELLAGMFILFITMCALAALVVSSTRYFANIENRAVALDILHHRCQDDVEFGAGNQYTDVSGYPSAEATAHTLQPTLAFTAVAPALPSFDSNEFTVVNEQVTTPLGETVNLQVGTAGPPLTAITVASARNMVAFNTSTQWGRLQIVDDTGATANVIATSPIMPSRGHHGPLGLPEPGSPGGLVCDAAFTTLYVADTNNGGIYQVSTGGGVPNPWWVGTPVGPDGWEMVMDGSMNVYTTAGEWSRNFYANTMGSTGNAIVSQYSLPPGAPIGSTVSIAEMPAGAYTNNFWVTDTDNLCLRRFTGNSGTATWDGNQYKLPIGPTHIGLPRGLAIDSLGNIFVIDATNLWEFPVSTNVYPETSLNGVATPLPAALIDMAAGLCIQRGMAGSPPAATDTIYINTRKDGLWRWPITPGGGSVGTPVQRLPDLP